MNKFEETIRKIVEEDYYGSSDVFLETIWLRAVLFLLLGGLDSIFVIYMLKSGHIPFFSIILSIIFFFIGIIYHISYNKSVKIFNK